MALKETRIRNASAALEAAIRQAFPLGLEVDEAGEPLADVSANAHARIRLAVARTLFRKEFRRGRDLDAYLGSLGDEHYGVRHNAINEALLPLYGVGPDSFWLNENLERGEMRRIGSLLEYDRASWERSESFRAEEGAAGAARPYAGSLHWEWARWLEGKRLVYGTLSLAAEILFSDLDDAMCDWLEERYPTAREADEKGGRLRWAEAPVEVAEEKYRVMRAGHEEMTRRLDESWRPWFEAQPAGACVNYRREGDDLLCDVSFMNTGTLGRVRPRSFLSDVAALPDASADVAAYAAKETEGFMAWLEAFAAGGVPRPS